MILYLLVGVVQLAVRYQLLFGSENKVAEFAGVLLGESMGLDMVRYIIQALKLKFA